MQEKDQFNGIPFFYAVLLIPILGALIYFNSLFNGFFADDFHQIVDNPAVHSLNNIPNFFTGSTFFTGSSELSGNYFKPLLPTAFAILYGIAGENPFPFHLLQVVLHISNALLVYFLFKFFFKNELSLLFSLLFLTHPINTETVVYIANLQDSLFLFFGLLSLIVNLNAKFFGKSSIVSLLLLLALLSKETAILFLLMLPLTNIVKEKKYWFRDTFISIFVIGIYCVLRFVVAGIYFNTITTAPIMMLSLKERILHTPFIIYFYIKTFFFPKDLIIFQTSVIKNIHIFNFHIPLMIDLIFFFLLFCASIWVHINANKLYKAFIFFFVWFFLGLLLHLQYFPLDGTVADRWFYFPIIGLLGMIAGFINSLLIEFNKNVPLRKGGVIVIISILIIFSSRVVIRNSDWKDQITLLSHDIKYNPESYQIQEGYGLELMKLKKFDEAFLHLLKSTEIFPGVYNLTSLGVYYANTSQMDKAEETLKNAMQYDDHILTYENYALLLFLKGDDSKTIEFTEYALAKFPNSHKIWLYNAISLYKNKQYDKALSAATLAYSLDPSMRKEYVLKAIKNNQQIDLSQL